MMRAAVLVVAVLAAACVVDAARKKIDLSQRGEKDGRPDLVIGDTKPGGGGGGGEPNSLGAFDFDDHISFDEYDSTTFTSHIKCSACEGAVSVMRDALFAEEKRFSREIDEVEALEAMENSCSKFSADWFLDAKAKPLPKFTVKPDGPSLRTSFDNAIMEDVCGRVHGEGDEELYAHFKEPLNKLQVRICNGVMGECKHSEKEIIKEREKHLLRMEEEKIKMAKNPPVPPPEEQEKQKGKGKAHTEL